MGLKTYNHQVSRRVLYRQDSSGIYLIHMTCVYYTRAVSGCETAAAAAPLTLQLHDVVEEFWEGGVHVVVWVWPVLALGGRGQRVLHEPQNLVSGQRQSQQHRQSLGEGGRKGGRDGEREGRREGWKEGGREGRNIYCSRSTALRLLVDLWLCHNHSYT